MGFYNVQQGDVPYLKQLADTYSMSDNYHQAVNGGTGANHIMLGTGDAIWFSDGNGNPAMPPHNQLVAAGTANAGVVDEIEDPDPLQSPGTNNWYTQDGYGGGSYGSASYGGGSYSDCADSSQPGVPAILSYLSALHVNPNCQTGHYYLLNNYNPGYYGDGTNAYLDSITAPNADLKTVFTVPPSTVPNIGDALLAKQVSFAYFGDQFYAYLANPLLNYVDVRQHLLQHLQLLPVLDLDHDQRPGAAGGAARHDRPLQRFAERQSAGGVVCQARRLSRRPPSIVKGQSARRLHQKDRRHVAGEPEAVGEHRGLYHNG